METWSLSAQAKRKMLVACVFLLCYGVWLDGAEESVVLVTHRDLNGPIGKKIVEIYTEAFKRLGREFEITNLPNKRASYMSSRGEVHGEAARIASYNQSFTNLIRVDEPLWFSGFAVVTKNRNIKLDDWDDLAEANYLIGFERGSKGSESALRGRIPSDRLSAVLTYTEGFKQLLADRIDVLVLGERLAKYQLQKDEYLKSGLRIAGLMEENLSIHGFVHQSRAKLAADLSRVLSEMRKGGFID